MKGLWVSDLLFLFFFINLYWGNLTNKLINKKMDTVLYSLILYINSVYLFNEVKKIEVRSERNLFI